MADSNRTTIKKELAAAIGNLEWSETHLSKVLAMFANAVLEFTEKEVEPPQTYIEVGEGLSTCLEAIAMIKETITNIDKKV